MELPLDRREHTRYSAHHLDVLIKSRRLEAGLWESGEVITVDFNRFGIGVETEHSFALGDLIAMIIRTDDCTITEICGVICNRTQCDNGYRLGVRFIDPTDQPQDESSMAFHQLFELEQSASMKLH